MIARIPLLAVLIATLPLTASAELPQVLIEAQIIELDSDIIDAFGLAWDGDKFIVSDRGDGVTPPRFHTVGETGDIIDTFVQFPNNTDHGHLDLSAVPGGFWGSE